MTHQIVPKFRNAYCVVVLCSFVTFCLADPAQLVKLDTARHPGAKCLDGSPGAFYFLNATSAASKNKWVFSLEGGGECVTQASCLARAETGLGSSKNYKSSTYLGQFQDSSSTNNPDMHDWNFVFIKYCSGDLHMGSMISPRPSTWGLQFSGHIIVDAILSTLVSDYGLDEGQEIVFSGDSAGGLGCVSNLDFVADRLPGKKVLGAPIGGFYFSNNNTYNGTDPKPISFIPWTFDALETYYHLWQAFVPTRCVTQRPSTPWQCMFGAASYGTIQTPLFIIEAQTDKVVMPLHNGLPPVWDGTGKECYNTVTNCPADIVAYMKTWSGMMVSALSQISASTGLFNPACLIHTGFTHTNPLIGGISYIKAFGDWAFRGVSEHLQDTCGVLCNPHC